MTEKNILDFPKKGKVDADVILQEATGKLEDCIILGVTKDNEAYYSICAQDAEQVIYLLRILEHMIIKQEMNEC